MLPEKSTPSRCDRIRFPRLRAPPRRSARWCWRSRTRAACRSCARHAARLEAFLVGGLQREIHVLFEFAAIVSESDAGFERQRARRDGVLAPQLRRIDAELVGGEIDHAFDDIAGLGAAVAAIGPHRLGMGEHGGDVDMRSGRAINAGQRAEIAGERRHADLHIGADRGNDFRPEAEENAVVIERQLGLGDIVARLGVAQKRFRARRHPLTGRPVSLAARGTSATSL